MNIIAKTYKWAYPLTRRDGKPTYVDWHHAAAKTLSPDGLHKIHLGLGWCGFAYNLYIRKDGRVYRGRPLAYCGGGAKYHWSDIGVCLEGNYDVEREMPPAQLRAAQEVKDWLDDRYPGIDHRGHRDVPDNATACPGKHFPVKAVMAGAPRRPYLHLSEQNITVPRQYKPHRAGWWATGLVPYIERVRRQGDGERVKTIGDPITIPVPAERPKWWAEMMRWKKKNRAEAKPPVVPEPPAAPAPAPAPVTRKRPRLFWRFKR